MDVFEGFEAEKESVLEHEGGVVDGGLIEDVVLAAVKGGNLDDIAGVVVDYVLRVGLRPHSFRHFIGIV